MAPEPAKPEVVVRAAEQRLTLELRFPPGVKLAPVPDPGRRFPPAARPRCPACGTLEVALTSTRSIPGRVGRVYYYRCTRCVDRVSYQYTRFKRVRRGAVNASSPRPAEPAE